jgi:hypothetical protein
MSKKKLLIQAAACNLALLMRSIYGTGKPKAAHDHNREAVLAILAFMRAVEALCQPAISTPDADAKTSNLIALQFHLSRDSKSAGLVAGCYLRTSVSL